MYLQTWSTVYAATQWWAAYAAFNSQWLTPLLITLTCQVVSLLLQFLTTRKLSASPNPRVQGMSNRVANAFGITQICVTIVAQCIDRGMRGYTPPFLANIPSLVLFASTTAATLLSITQAIYRQPPLSRDAIYALLVWTMRWNSCWINASWPYHFGIAMWLGCQVLFAFSIVIYMRRTKWRTAKPDYHIDASNVYEYGHRRDDYPYCSRLAVFQHGDVRFLQLEVQVGFVASSRLIPPALKDCFLLLFCFLCVSAEYQASFICDVGAASLDRVDLVGCRRWLFTKRRCTSTGRAECRSHLRNHCAGSHYYFVGSRVLVSKLQAHNAYYCRC